MFKQAYTFMLNRWGQDVTLKRERPAPLAAQVKAKVRSVKPDEIEGGVLQTDMLIICQVPPTPPWDGSELKKGDRVIIGDPVTGRLVTIEMRYPLHEGATIVAYRLICRG